jgi:mannose-6-phosphate isomerase-like protein (cupin superfamily)
MVQNIFDGRHEKIDEDMEVFVHDNICKNLSSATVKLNGRYPKKGQTRNNGVDEMYYIISGSGVFGMDGKESEIQVGDVVFIPKGREYSLYADNVELISISSPKWTDSQKEFLND